MAQMVPISQVTVNRELKTGDDITGLVKSLQEDGQQIPILVDADYALIDGLRRLRALQSFGATQIEVFATSMYPAACDLLNRAREHGVEALPISPRRIYEITVSMKPVLYATVNYYKIGRKKGANAKASAGGRRILAKALGLPSEGMLQATLQVFYAAKDPTTEKGRRALRLLELMEKGEISPYAASNRLTSTEGLHGSIKKYQDQLSALDAALASLRGTMRALEDLGPLDPKFPKEEAEAKYKELYRLRGQFYRFVRTFDEEINKNVQ